MVIKILNSLVYKIWNENYLIEFLFRFMSPIWLYHNQIEQKFRSTLKLSI